MFCFKVRKKTKEHLVFLCHKDRVKDRWEVSLSVSPCEWVFLWRQGEWVGQVEVLPWEQTRGACMSVYACEWVCKRASYPARLGPVLCVWPPEACGTFLAALFQSPVANKQRGREDGWWTNQCPIYKAVWTRCGSYSAVTLTKTCARLASYLEKHIYFKSNLPDCFEADLLMKI